MAAAGLSCLELAAASASGQNMRRGAGLGVIISRLSVMGFKDVYPMMDLIWRLLFVLILVALVQGVGTALLFRHHWKRDIALLRACLPTCPRHFFAIR